MEQQNNEQILAQAQPVNTEKQLGERTDEISLGKFKDVSQLLSAYNSLQSEFTKRCQKIKELESAIAVDKANAPTETDKQGEQEKRDITQLEKEEILKDYLKELLDKKQKAIVMDGFGVGVKTPCERPKTIEQAGQLAKELLTKK